MKNFYRYVGVFIACVLVLMLYAGCSASNAATSTTTLKPSATTSKQGTETTKSTTTQQTSEDLEPANVIWVVLGDVMEDSKMVWEEVNGLLSEKLPQTTLEVMPFGWAAYNDQIRLMISSSEDFDIMWAADWMGDYMEKVTGGAFQPIEDLINENAPGLWSAIPEIAWPAGEVDGVLYGIPTYQLLVRGSTKILPLSLVEQSGIDVLKIEQMAIDPQVSGLDILKELETFYIWAKENTAYHPTTVNRAHILPLDKSYELLYRMSNIGIVGVKKYSSELTVYNLFDTQEFRDYLDLTRDFYQKGYYPEDILGKEPAPEGVFVHAIWRSNINLRDIGMTPTGNAIVDKDESDFYGEPMANIMTIPYYNEAKAGAATMNFINNNSKHPERAIRVIEVVNSDPEIYNMLCFGIADTHYKRGEDGTFTGLKDTYSLYPWILGNVTQSYANSAELNELIDKLNKEAQNSPVRGFTINVDPLRNQLAQIGAIIDEYYDPLIFGILSDYQQKYEIFLSQLITAGIDQVVEEVQKQVDEWAATP